MPHHMALLKNKFSSLVYLIGGKNLHFDWTSVNSWQLFPDKNILKYTVRVDNNLHTAGFQTDRSKYMLAITKEMINKIQVQCIPFITHLIITQIWI